jgi:hypothetical protein
MVDFPYPIALTKFTPIGGGYIIGAADVQFPSLGFEIKNLAVKRLLNGGYFVSPPRQHEAFQHDTAERNNESMTRGSPVINFLTYENQCAFSNAVVALAKRAHPAAFCHHGDSK